MKERFIILIVFQSAETAEMNFETYDDYLNFEPNIKDPNSFKKTNTLLSNGLTRPYITKRTESPLLYAEGTETTECITDPPLSTLRPQELDITTEEKPPTDVKPPPKANKSDHTAISEENENDKARQLKKLIQLLYIGQARVQLEASEIKKSQAVANSAQQSLEEATNHVREITANLQNSQQEVASAAIRAQTAQLQLAAHDQLLFAARQDVDALSTQLVGLQAAEGITQPKTTIDLADLLEKLNQPLPEAEKPTPVPVIVQISTQATTQQKIQKLQLYNALHFKPYYYI